MRALVLCGVLVVVGCGMKPQVCIPGAQVACACVGGTQGAQACNADGTALEACNCTTPTGGGGGTTTGGGNGSTGGGNGTTGGGTGGGAATEDAGTDAGTQVDAGLGTTIAELTTGTIGLGTTVQLSNVVVMSQKFLISKSNTTGSCLWGLYVSAPNLTTTAANTGLLVINFGTNASTPSDGGTTTFCPRLGLEPTGGVLPDTAKPGDVLTVSGTTERLVANAGSCGGTIASALQLRATSASITGTASIPTPAVLSSTDAAKLFSTTDQSFHDAWGSVKVSLSNVTSSPQNGNFTDAFGNFFVSGGSLQVNSRVYYRAALAASQACHARPVSNATTTFSKLSGFNTLNFCTWSFDVNDKCADLTPSSTDCASATACVP